MRGRHHAHVSLLQTGVDVACRLGKLAPRRQFDGGAFFERPVDLAGYDDHDAAGGPDASLEQPERGELNTALFDAAAG